MRTLAIVPTYNERENLPAITAALLKIPDLRVLVADDGSPDGTGAIADDLAARHPGRVSVLHRSGTRGLGRSYIQAMRSALTTDIDAVVQIDADLSHDPDDVPRLVAASRDADLVIGSRYVPGGRVANWPARRLLLSTVANRYVHLLTGMPVVDCTSGFRCWRRDALARMPLERIQSDGYSFQVEMTWEAHRAGFRIVEVPITFVERREGASKLTGRVLVESAVLPLRLAARRWHS